ISASVQVLATSWVLLASAWCFGQTSGDASGSVASSGSTGAPVTLTLQDALERAKKLNPDYRSAVTDYGLAHEDEVQSRAALLPNVNFNTSYVYTQGNGTATGRFIANNAVHEYVSQGNVHQDLSLANFADYRRTQFLEAAARARSEVAARGL